MSPGLIILPHIVIEPEIKVVSGCVGNITVVKGLVELVGEQRRVTRLESSLELDLGILLVKCFHVVRVCGSKSHACNGAASERRPQPSC